MHRPIHTDEIEPQTAQFLPTPFAEIVGPYEGRDLSAAFELDRFGAHLETLFPNSQSALRHWHSDSDELVLVMEGELVLVCEQGEFVLSAGMCVGFKADEQNGHHLINRSNDNARFLVIGSRSKDDTVHYPDDDLTWIFDGSGWKPARKDGTLYEPDK